MWNTVGPIHDTPPKYRINGNLKDPIGFISRKLYPDPVIRRVSVYFTPL